MHVPVPSSQEPSQARTTLWLVIILVFTALLWSGSSFIGLATDDYHYLHVLAPISNLGDALDAFTRPDANPYYWRPVSNMTLMLDFLLYGWSGGGYHVTNLLLHLIATTLVFKSCRSVFDLDEHVSLFTAFLFGISAGHDMNLLWVAARGDILVTIFSLSTLLLLHKKGLGWQFIRLSTFFLALCSKELAILLIPVAAIVEWRSKNWKNVAVTTLSMIVIAGVFFALRSNFTDSASGADPMLGEGMSDPLAALRNVVYGVGYLLLPLDLSSAATVLSSYRVTAFIGAFIAVLLLLVLLWKQLRSIGWKSTLLPLLFFLIFSIVVAQSFERWRLYAPSVGLYALLAIMVVQLWRTTGFVRRAIVVLPLGVLLVFHLYRSIIEQQSWEEASIILNRTKEQLKPILATSGDAPLLFLTRPAKYGGGSIMKVSNSHIVLQAKAELQNVPELQYGGTGNTHVKIEMAMQALALSPNEGFAPITVEKLGENVYSISVPKESSTRLLAETAETGSRPRERKLQPGDSLTTAVGLVVVNSADRNYAISATLYLKPHRSRLIYFDGSTTRTIE